MNVRGESKKWTLSIKSKVYMRFLSNYRMFAINLIQTSIESFRQKSLDKHRFYGNLFDAC